MSESAKKIDLAVRGALWFGALKGKKAAPNAKKKGQLVDLFVAKGKVVSLAPAGSLKLSAARELEAGGKVLLPSLTDAHTHLREPGQEYKEDVESGLCAAAHGGFSNIMCMANTRPVNDNASVTELMHK